MDFDTLIVNGAVVDGAGAPRYTADVGITADRIAAVGDLSDSQTMPGASSTLPGSWSPQASSTCMPTRT